MICAIAAYLLRLEPVTALDDEEEIAQRAGEETDSLLAGQSNAEDKREIKRERRRKVKIASQAAAEMEVGEHDERDEQHERAEENAPRQAGRNVKQRRGSRAEKNTKEKTDRNGEDPFEKIVD
ncbi:hypothetical protein SDC9_211204 [bioreactor metagenome]|uniref:Uncharacterized protein n=1 Tax=bioreactor metagenome TaxID=1076179 RepID=A0A645JID0_9ZZZZ